MAPGFVMTTYAAVMTERGKYERTPETRAKNAEAMRGRKLSPEAITKRTATRRTTGAMVTHGKSRTPTYNSWDSMLQRCTNPNSPAWQYYGGRGIAVCERWRTFANFLADMGERPEGLTLDRIDNDGNYEPGNCRWADGETQRANRRRSSYYDRPSRVPECGHPDRPHKARGMCGACYFTWRVGSQKKDTDARVKLTEENVAWIKSHAGKLSQRAMAESLGVSQSTVSLILNGKRRADL